jgi:hypothetical protein
VSYIGAQPPKGQYRKLRNFEASFDGILTSFQLEVDPGGAAYYVIPGSANQLIVSLGGVIQEPNVDYTVSSSQITFTTAPAGGLNCFIIQCGDALNIGVPSDGTVSASKLNPAGGLEGQTFVLDSSLQFAFAYAGGATGGRNRIINGDMRIDQRNAGAALNNAANGSWAVDRWVRYQNVGASNIGRNLNSITPPAGFTNYLGIQISTAGTASASQYTNFQHYIEGFNAADLAWGTANAQSATISFWVRSSLTGGQGFALQNGNSTLGYPFTVNISAANTWEYKSITIPGPTTGTWDTTNGRGITLIVDLGMGSNFRFTSGSWQSANVQGATGALNLNQTLNATFYITGVQLEPGSTATPFERRSYGQELAMCQRYAYAAEADGAVNSFMVLGIGRWYGGADAQIVIQHPVPMRSAPSLESNTAVGTFAINTEGTFVTAALTGISLNEAGINVSTISANYSAGGRTTGQATTLYCNNTYLARLVFSAEL